MEQVQILELQILIVLVKMEQLILEVVEEQVNVEMRMEDQVDQVDLELF
jgi:hypothetical protein